MRGVEVAGRLVCKEQLRAMNERARDGGPLHLAAAELVHAVVGAIGEMDQIEQLIGFCLHFPERRALEQQGEADVLPHGHGRQEIEELEDDPELALAVERKFALPCLVQGEIADKDFSLGGPIEAAEEVQEGALAAAAWAGDRQEVVARNLQRYAIERGAGVRIEPGDLYEADHLVGDREQFTPEPLQPVLTTNTSTSKIPVRFRIVEETADYLVVDKPPFLQAHPSKPSDIRTLWDGLRELLAYELANGGQVSLINRLDRETSGLTLVAKHKQAAREFGIRMEQRRIAKAYLAIVWGWPEAEEWTVDAPILRQGEVRPSPIHLKQAVHPSGAPAATKFQVRHRVRLATPAGERFSVVEAFPQTGRMHQLRVHLAHSGHPIVGDKIYGPDEQCYLEFIRTGWTEALATRLLLPRHALHASFLQVPDLALSWSAPLPGDLEDFLHLPLPNL